MTTASTPCLLFGSSKPFLPPSWTTTDDRVRGGSSISHLDSLPNNCARFYGHLDTSTLGGAGFASQFSPEDGSWDLSLFDGIELEFQEGDEKVYTFILKDEESPGKREDGREKAGTNWEIEFRAGRTRGTLTRMRDGDMTIEKDKSDSTKVWMPWADFKATYRGREKKDAGKLKTTEVRRVGIMMRSYFGKQDGDFSIELRSISARKEMDDDKDRRASMLMADAEDLATTSTNEKTQKPKEEENKGWLASLVGLLYRPFTPDTP